MTNVSPTLRAYELGVRGSEHTQTLHALSPGKAKAEFRRSFLYDLDIPFTAIRCRVIGAVEPLSLHRVAIYRGLPFVRAAMRIEVDGMPGRIVGANDSAKFDVLFEAGRHAGQTLNCHPTWKTKYIDEDGKVLADFTGGDHA